MTPGLSMGGVSKNLKAVFLNCHGEEEERHEVREDNPIAQSFLHQCNGADFLSESREEPLEDFNKGRILI